MGFRKDENGKYLLDGHDSYVNQDKRDILQSWLFKYFNEARIRKFELGLFELEHVVVVRIG